MSEMLETTDASIMPTANRCGFGRQGSLQRSMTSLLGISPSTYRKRFEYMTR
ncbi:MAG: hypothetical protein AAFV49_03790 [Pseudomonadota bacterium]